MCLRGERGGGWMDGWIFSFHQSSFNEGDFFWHSAALYIYLVLSELLPLHWSQKGQRCIPPIFLSSTLCDNGMHFLSLPLSRWPQLIHIVPPRFAKVKCFSDLSQVSTNAQKCKALGWRGSYGQTCNRGSGSGTASRDWMQWAHQTRMRSTSKELNSQFSNHSHLQFARIPWSRDGSRRNALGPKLFFVTDLVIFVIAVAILVCPDLFK